MQIKLSIRILISIIIFTWIIGFSSYCLSSIDLNLIKYLPFIKKFYSSVCHQDNSKVLNICCGYTFVCSRCAGLYIGFFFISIIFLFYPSKNTPHVKYLFIAAVPLFTDVLFTTIKLYEYIKALSFLTGFLLGSILFLYFYKALLLLFKEIYPQGIK